MKWYIPHKRKGTIELEVSNFTQVIGTNHQLIYDVMQIIKWYFCGRKYTEEDLSLFSQNEIEIRNDENTIKRDSYKTFYFDTMDSFLDQLSFKKGTISFEYLRLKMRSIEIEENIEMINNSFIELINQINNDCLIQMRDYQFHVDIKELISETIIQKSLLPSFGTEDLTVSFELIDNSEKFLLLSNMIEEIMQRTEDNYLFIFDGVDRYINEFEYTIFLNKMYSFSKESNLFLINTVFNSNYLLMDSEIIESINLISDRVTHYLELPFMKSRFINSFPRNITISDSEMMSILKRLGNKILSKNLLGDSISEFDLISIAIVNNLYGFMETPNIQLKGCSEMERNFINSYYFNLENLDNIKNGEE